MTDLSAIWSAPLMTLDDIAAMWQVSRLYARDVLTKQDGFPPPVPGSTRKFQRWSRADIMAFAGVATESDPA